ncbi:MAG: AraC family transcriptional regulator [Firmicutes bacterium]|nr:AraC family transcriptional regulator [Bacillota bacterium]
MAEQQRQHDAKDLVETVTFYASTGDIALEHMVRRGHFDMKVKHFHPEYEIFYILQGQRNFFFDNRSMTASEGDLILIDSNLIHTTRSVSEGDLGHNRIILYVTSDKMQRFDRQYPELNLVRYFHQNYGIYHLTPEQQSRFMDFYYFFKEETRTCGPHYKLMVDLQTVFLLAHMTRDLRRENQISFAEAKDPVQANAYRIADYLYAHYGEDLSLDQIAERFSFSKYYISRTFREVTGYTLREYQNLYRIRAAKQLLEETGLPVDEVASRVGYHSAVYFGKIFKKYMGLSPLQYRKHPDRYVDTALPLQNYLREQVGEVRRAVETSEGDFISHQTDNSGKPLGESRDKGDKQ